MPQLTEDQLAAGWRSYDVTRVCGHGETVWIKAADHLNAIVKLKAKRCTRCDSKASQVHEESNG